MHKLARCWILLVYVGYMFRIFLIYLFGVHSPGRARIAMPFRLDFIAFITIGNNCIAIVKQLMYIYIEREIMYVMLYYF